MKRRIDTTNQLRNDLAEELDRVLLDWLAAQQYTQPRGGPAFRIAGADHRPALDPGPQDLSHARRGPARRRARRTRGAQSRPARHSPRAARGPRPLPRRVVARYAGGNSPLQALSSTEDVQRSHPQSRRLPKINGWGTVMPGADSLFPIPCFLTNRGVIGIKRAHANGILNPGLRQVHLLRIKLAS